MPDLRENIVIWHAQKASMVWIVLSSVNVKTVVSVHELMARVVVQQGGLGPTVIIRVI